MISSQCADQAPCELPAERLLEAVAGERPSAATGGHAGAVVEESADGSFVIGRQSVHGTLSIVVPPWPSHP